VKRTPLEITGVENPFVKHVNGRGCLAIKLSVLGRRGLPDRLVLGPKRFIVFFELKRLGKKPEPLQEWFHKILRGFGFDVVVPDSKEEAIAEFERLLKAHKSRTKKKG